MNQKIWVQSHSANNNTHKNKRGHLLKANDLLKKYSKIN